MASENKPRKRRGCLIPLVILSVIFAVIAVGVAVGVTQTVSTPKQSALAKEMKLTDQQEQTMLSVFEACGIQEVTEVTKFQEGDDQTSYLVSDIETNSYGGARNYAVVWVDNSTKAVQSIYYNDHDIYIDGAVASQISDFYVSAAQREDYRVVAQLLVKECLNYPDSAKFEGLSKWGFGVNEDGYDVVQSSVTAKNAFGMESTEKFQVLVDRATGTPVSLIIGETEYIK